MNCYDCLVVFDKAYRIPSIEKLAYGFGIPHYEKSQDELEIDIQNYVEYLCALIKWLYEGGTVDGENYSIWIDPEGNIRTFSLDDDFFITYLQNAYKERPIDYMVIYNANSSFLDNEVERDFITKNIRTLWKR